MIFSRITALAALAGLMAAGRPAVPAAGAQPQALPTQAQTPIPPFRSGIDLIPVDVQVVDHQGQPITDLDLGSFEVSIDGRRRRVVSVQLVDHQRLPPSASHAATAPPAGDPSAAGPASDLEAAPRVFVLAVDAASFDQSVVQPVIAAAARFIERLRPDDEVGLFTFPLGPKVDPSTDHAAVIDALQQIVARRDVPWTAGFTLLPADLVELSLWTANLPYSDYVERLARALCPEESLDDPGPCLFQLQAAVTSALVAQEGQVLTTISTLRSLMAELGTVPIRKTVVLLSGGLVTADRVGARPDGMGLGLEAGRTAAESNVSVYTVFIDHSGQQVMAAESRRGRNLPVDAARDSAIYSQWLDQFSGRAGGLMLPVRAGDGSAAFDRILLETSAYYLLGVEPDARDRDGRAHELHVRVRGRQANVRGRSWVLIPREGDTGPVRDPRRRAAPAIAGAATRPPGRPVGPALRALADAFDRDDRPAIVAAINARDGISLVQALRQSESPWPDSPDRTAAFALEVAIAGLRTGVRVTAEESLRLLAEYTVRVRRPVPNDPYECAWLRTQAAGLLGLQSPEITTGLVQHAARRCPDDPRLRLGAAVALDQLLEQSAAIRGGADAVVQDTERQVLEAFAAVGTDPAVQAEAAVRTAWLHHRAGRHAEGLEQLEGVTVPAGDAVLRYFCDVVRGQLLRRAGRPDEAADAYRAAIGAWPEGQTARIALLTLQVQRGDGQGAGALAEQVLSAGPETGDPWWVFRLGDYRGYAELRARLREFVR
jgi:VWFA-related protein